ncbi:MAG: hybrid sensor histidine kinase/response regulator [Chloroflexales bacterium]|nr:hybrid sensor histidine kinase/response regulator [Chloroflexales bacterium]
MTRVLIAEDDYLVSEMIKGVAESIGYTVVGEAFNGKEAVAMTQSLHPDAVIMDIQMPDMDGIAAAQQISACCPTPVVVLTAYETPELLQRASEAGVTAYLVKPPQAREMERAITISIARFHDFMEMRRLKAEAEAAIQSRDNLFALIAHDLTNPLTSIKGCVELAKMNFTDTASSQVDEQVLFELTKIDEAADQMVAQVEEFLDIARLRAGQTLNLQYRSTDLVALARQIVNEKQRTISVHRLQVEAAIPSLVGNVDKNRLERVINNLLSNAIKYSPSGGVITLTVSYEQAEESCWAILSITDQGIGIPTDDLPHIFEPFHRASNVTGRFHGAGLGLASVRQIVEQHGGTIAAASSVGSGSVLTVRLPLFQAENQEQHNAPVR